MYKTEIKEIQQLKGPFKKKAKKKKHILENQ